MRRITPAHHRLPASSLPLQNAFSTRRTSTLTQRRVFLHRAGVGLSRRFYSDEKSTEEAAETTGKYATVGRIECGGTEGIGVRNPDMAIAFTCTVCETRSYKAFTKKAYEEGVVVIQCPGCKSLHLIADNLGWFDEGKINVETIAAHSNNKLVVKKIAKEIEITVEDLQRLEETVTLE